MAGKRIHWSAEMARSLEKRWRRSGLSVAAFCAREGVPSSSFEYWRRKLREERGAHAPHSGGFVELQVEPVAAAAPDASEDWVCEVEVEGAVIRLRRGFDPEQAASFVGALRRAASC